MGLRPKVTRAGARNDHKYKRKRRGTLAPPYKVRAIIRGACGARGAFQRAVGDAGPYGVRVRENVQGRAAA